MAEYYDQKLRQAFERSPFDNYDDFLEDKKRRDEEETLYRRWVADKSKLPFSEFKDYALSTDPLKKARLKAAQPSRVKRGMPSPAPPVPDFFFRASAELYDRVKAFSLSGHFDPPKEDTMPMPTLMKSAKFGGGGMAGRASIEGVREEIKRAPKEELTTHLLAGYMEGRGAYTMAEEVGSITPLEKTARFVGAMSPYMLELPVWYGLGGMGVARFATTPVGRFAMRTMGKVKLPAIVRKPLGRLFRLKPEKPVRVVSPALGKRAPGALGGTKAAVKASAARAAEIERRTAERKITSLFVGATYETAREMTDAMTGGQFDWWMPAILAATYQIDVVIGRVMDASIQKKLMRDTKDMLMDKLFVPARENGIITPKEFNAWIKVPIEHFKAFSNAAKKQIEVSLKRILLKSDMINRMRRLQGVPERVFNKVRSMSPLHLEKEQDAILRSFEAFTSNPELVIAGDRAFNQTTILERTIETSSALQTLKKEMRETPWLVYTNPDKFQARIDKIGAKGKLREPATAKMKVEGIKGEVVPGEELTAEKLADVGAYVKELGSLEKVAERFPGETEVDRFARGRAEELFGKGKRAKTAEQQDIEGILDQVEGALKDDKGRPIRTKEQKMVDTLSPERKNRLVMFLERGHRIVEKGKIDAQDVVSKPDANRLLDAERDYFILRGREIKQALPAANEEMERPFTKEVIDDFLTMKDEDLGRKGIEIARHMKGLAYKNQLSASVLRFAGTGQIPADEATRIINLPPEEFLAWAEKNKALVGQLREDAVKLGVAKTEMEIGKAQAGTHTPDELPEMVTIRKRRPVNELEENELIARMRYDYATQLDNKEITPEALYNDFRQNRLRAYQKRKDIVSEEEFVRRLTESAPDGGFEETTIPFRATHAYNTAAGPEPVNITVSSEGYLVTERTGLQRAISTEQLAKYSPLTDDLFADPRASLLPTETMGARARRFLAAAIRPRVAEVPIEGVGRRYTAPYLQQRFAKNTRTIASLDQQLAPQRNDLSKLIYSHPDVKTEAAINIEFANMGLGKIREYQLRDALYTDKVMEMPDYLFRFLKEVETQLPDIPDDVAVARVRSMIGSLDTGAFSGADREKALQTLSLMPFLRKLKSGKVKVNTSQGTFDAQSMIGWEFMLPLGAEWTSDGNIAFVQPEDMETQLRWQDVGTAALIFALAARRGGKGRGGKGLQRAGKRLKNWLKPGVAPKTGEKVVKAWSETSAKGEKAIREVGEELSTIERLDKLLQQQAEDPNVQRIMQQRAREADAAGDPTIANVPHFIDPASMDVVDQRLVQEYSDLPKNLAEVMEMLEPFFYLEASTGYSLAQAPRAGIKGIRIDEPFVKGWEKGVKKFTNVINGKGLARALTHFRTMWHESKSHPELWQYARASVWAQEAEAVMATQYAQKLQNTLWISKRLSQKERNLFDKYMILYKRRQLTPSMKKQVRTEYGESGERAISAIEEWEAISGSMPDEQIAALDRQIEINMKTQGTDEVPPHYAYLRDRLIAIRDAPRDKWNYVPEMRGRGRFGMSVVLAEAKRVEPVRATRERAQRALEIGPNIKSRMDEILEAKGLIDPEKGNYGNPDMVWFRYYNSEAEAKAHLDSPKLRAEVESHLRFMLGDDRVTIDFTAKSKDPNALGVNYGIYRTQGNEGLEAADPFKMMMELESTIVRQVRKAEAGTGPVFARTKEEEEAVLAAYKELSPLLFPYLDIMKRKKMGATKASLEMVQAHIPGFDNKDYISTVLRKTRSSYTTPIRQEKKRIMDEALKWLDEERDRGDLADFIRTYHYDFDLYGPDDKALASAVAQLKGVGYVTQLGFPWNIGAPLVNMSAILWKAPARISLITKQLGSSVGLTRTLDGISEAHRALRQVYSFGKEPTTNFLRWDKVLPEKQAAVMKHLEATGQLGVNLAADFSPELGTATSLASATQWQRAQKVASAVFSKSEQHVRRTTTLSLVRTLDKHFPDMPIDELISRTGAFNIDVNLNYDPTNRAAIAKRFSGVLSVPYLFQSFMIDFFETNIQFVRKDLTKLSKHYGSGVKAIGDMLLMIGAIGGLKAMPGVDTVDEMITIRREGSVGIKASDAAYMRLVDTMRDIGRATPLFTEAGGAALGHIMGKTILQGIPGGVSAFLTEASRETGHDWGKWVPIFTDALRMDFPLATKDVMGWAVSTVQEVATSWAGKASHMFKRARKHPVREMYSEDFWQRMRELGADLPIRAVKRPADVIMEWLDYWPQGRLTKGGLLDKDLAGRPVFLYQQPDKTIQWEDFLAGLVSCVTMNPMVREQQKDQRSREFVMKKYKENIRGYYLQELRNGVNTQHPDGFDKKQFLDRVFDIYRWNQVLARTQKRYKHLPVAQIQITSEDMHNTINATYAGPVRAKANRMISLIYDVLYEGATIENKFPELTRDDFPMDIRRLFEEKWNKRKSTGYQ